MKFLDLVAQISEIDGAARVAAGRSLQQILSLRNWVIGASIVEFEQAGEDRAGYGERLLPRLAKALTDTGSKGLSARNLKNCRQVALAYPGLDVVALGRQAAFLVGSGPAANNGQAPVDSRAKATIRQAPAASGNGAALAGAIRQAPAVSGNGAAHTGAIRQAPAESAEHPFPSIARRASEDPDLPWRDAAWLSRLFSELSFTHLVELSRIDGSTKRAFYELHCLKERWSYRELQRQRDSMLYERIGLSESRSEVLALARDGVIADSPAAQLRDPYVFEFLGLQRRAVEAESDLEQALIDHLQHFLLELGRDFCFVDRQFRITAGNRHHYLDLLFFHRRLRCLVAIDLKLGEFKPDQAGQLRFYVNYLAEQVAHEDENPPVGILLCAERDAEVVRFATAGDDDLFVTRYQLELPSEDQLRRWLHEERARIEQVQGEPDEARETEGEDE
jgi:predicted nuclease of restriction endonuclease-like (RecB) superfamily